MNLPVLQPHEVTSRTDLFECPVYDAKISASCCSARQALVKRGIGGDAYRLCSGCALGTAIEAQTGGPVPVDAHAGENESARAKGGQRARGRPVRWRNLARKGAT